MKLVYAAIVLIVLIVIFVVSFLLNKKTEKPEGCEEITEQCMHCSITSCSHNKIKEENKDE